MTTQIDAGDLKRLIDQNAVKVVDGSWALDGTDMFAAYRLDHIPGAFFFDIEAISDHSTPLPHMAPTPAQFADSVSAMGISETDHVVIYDRQGLFSAARVWWTFKLMGHEKVQVLCGGLPAWKAAGLKTTNEIIPPEPAVYTPHPKFDIVIDMNGLERLLDKRNHVILDARPAARFAGTAAEPRVGLRPGHMPGAHSLPFGELIRDGALKPKDELEAIFERYDVKNADRLITSCGSGVTAAIISMALYEVGHTEARLYDGSWAEWGQTGLDMPVVSGS